MADEKRGKGDGAGPFELGRSYDEVGPDLGRLHEAWHVQTGRPALRFFPTDRVQWQPSGRWEALVVCEPSPSSVTVLVGQAPGTVPSKELVDVFVLTSAALTRVEDNAQLRAHLASGLEDSEASLAPPRPRERTMRRRVATGLALALGVWLTSLHPTFDPRESSTAPLGAEAPSGVSFGDWDEAAVLAYAPPQKPFRNQQTAPCPRRKVVVEINEGCWVALDQRPPCEEDQAEHQGKCYLPVLKPQPIPRATEP